MILIVDDEEPLARAYCRILNAYGFNAEYTGMGGYALSIIERRNPELVIVDLLLPDMNGIEMSERARERGYSGPIMLVSGAINPLDDNLRFLASRMEAFDFAEKKQKPIMTPELVEIASRFAQKREL